MSERERLPSKIDLAAWVEQATADPLKWRDRQVTEIVLTAISITPELNKGLVLKGGILMSLAFGSARQTGDIDFTAEVDPQPFADDLRSLLDTAMRRAGASLGYTDLRCRVQRLKRKPREENFEGARAPALQLTIGHAGSGTNEAEALERGKASRVVYIDISFKEQVFRKNELMLQKPSVSIQAYDLTEVIAEKLRALLQQPVRNRTRRQDVYDIDWLITRFSIDQEDKRAILLALMEKSSDREIVPTARSFDDPKVKEFASREWNSMALELGEDLPVFEEAYERVRDFYLTLPWE